MRAQDYSRFLSPAGSTVLWLSKRAEAPTDLKHNAERADSVFR